MVRNTTAGIPSKEERGEAIQYVLHFTCLPVVCGSFTAVLLSCMQAGTGGKAGPYRVDGGDDIYETTEADKQNVSPEVMAAKIAMRRVQIGKALQLQFTC